jgi:hypothetical protein
MPGHGVSNGTEELVATARMSPVEGWTATMAAGSFTVGSA